MRRNGLLVRRLAVAEEATLAGPHLEETEVLTVLGIGRRRDSHHATATAGRQYCPKTPQIAARGGALASRLACSRASRIRISRR